MKTVLITGGAGFIGSHIAIELIQRGYRVIIYDNFNDYYEEYIKWNNVRLIEKSAILDGTAVIIRGDIRDKERLNDVFENYAIDSVIHLAALAGVRNSFEKPELYAEVNVIGTVNVLEGMKLAGVKTMVFASSSSVYGDCAYYPSDEEQKCIPKSVYACSKLSGEYLCRAYSNMYGMNIACLRLFSVYGERMRTDLAIYGFSDKLFLGEAIKKFGNGDTCRDYTYISDVVYGINAAMRYAQDNAGFEIFNIGAGESYSLNQLLGFMEEIFNKKGEYLILDERGEDAKITHSDITKASMLLEYKPKIHLETGLKQFAKWYHAKNSMEKYYM